MSVLAFQKLSGDLSTDGKILVELQKLNQKNGLPDLYYFFDKLYPNREPFLIERSFNSGEPDGWFPRYWNNDPNDEKPFGGSFWGYWNLTAFSGGENEDRDDASLVNSDGQLVCYVSNRESHASYMGEATKMKRHGGYINVNAHFLGFAVIDQFAYNTKGFNGNVQIEYDESPLEKGDISNGKSYVDWFEDSDLVVKSPYFFKVSGEGEPPRYPEKVGDLYQFSVTADIGQYYLIEVADFPYFDILVDFPFNAEVQYSYAYEPPFIDFNTVQNKKASVQITQLTGFKVRSLTRFDAVDSNDNNTYSAFVESTGFYEMNFGVQAHLDKSFILIRNHAE
ncbi:hypothetical protein [Flavobacterium phage FLiP]|uniref:Uncharacterized protein n=1 Tax=Flavobacterium phage FLiP TaxID=2023716 RepID=A0A222NP83_9VIRU|nr:hypothetical protein HOR88_gp13 [Flavobacterium phage FLiP]ASQ41213.1 hypothetical protein [Flavobacterium phage FLiP]